MYRPFIWLYTCIYITDATTFTMHPSTKTNIPGNVSLASRTTHKVKSKDVSTKEVGMVNITRKNLLYPDMKNVCKMKVDHAVFIYVFIFSRN